MKTCTIFSGIAACVFFSSCAPPSATNPMLRNQPVAIDPMATYELTTGLRVSGKGAVEPLKVQDFTASDTLHIDNRREFVYPTDYELAESTGSGIEPATPTDFKVEKVGLLADLKTENRGGYTMLIGDVTLTEFQGFSKMGGEAGLPIVGDDGKLLTENKIETPKFATYTTHILTTLRPDKPTSVEISHPKDGTTLVFELKAK